MKISVADLEKTALSINDKIGKKGVYIEFVDGCRILQVKRDDNLLISIGDTLETQYAFLRGIAIGFSISKLKTVD